MTPRAVLACPGRGSYAAAALGSLPFDHPWVQRAEQLPAGSCDLRPSSSTSIARRRFGP